MSAEDVRTLDPALGYDVVSWTFEQMLFNTLVDYDDEMGLVPELASSWTVSPDGRRYSFTLRPGVRFSTGRPFTAADVAYSLERLLRTRASPGARFFSGLVGAGAFAAGRAKTISGIDARDPGRVIFTLEKPDPLFLHKLAMPFAAVVDREAAERYGEDFARHPVGTGPFTLAGWVYGQRLVLRRNPRYFRTGLPYLDGVELTIGVSPQLAWFKYEAGEVDISGIPPAEFPRVVSDPRFAPLLLHRTTLRTQYVGLNCEMRPFDHIAVRRAVNIAVNKERILELINRQGVVARGILPPDMPGFDPTLKGWPHDPERARRLLAAAGLPARELRATFWVSSDDTSLRIAQSIQQDLRDIGLRLEIKPVGFPALIEAIRNPHMVPLFLLGWEADFPDPSNFLSVLLHSRQRGDNNNTFYSNPRVDALLDSADSLLDSARRLELYREAERLIVADAPWVPLFHPVGYVVRNPRVRGYHLHPLRPARVEEVWLADQPQVATRKARGAG